MYTCSPKHDEARYRLTRSLLVRCWQERLKKQAHVLPPVWRTFTREDKQEQLEPGLALPTGVVIPRSTRRLYRLSTSSKPLRCVLASVHFVDNVGSTLLSVVRSFVGHTHPFSLAVCPSIWFLYKVGHFQSSPHFDAWCPGRSA